jgi:Spore coat polysaccharide biosynthesis protein F, CMP-KDO synthetase homolog
MNVSYELFVVLFKEGKPVAAADDFVKRFGPSQTAQAGIFSFRDKETARQALDAAAKDHLEPQLFYAFHVDAEAIATAPAFYLSVDVEEDILAPDGVQSHFLTNVEVALDLYFDVILVNQRVKDLLEKHAVGVQFNAIDENGWFRLDGITNLPEPIVVPKPMYRSPNETPPGTWAVQSDGRDVLTEANLAWVREHGLAVSHEVKTPADRVAWRPRVVVSGNLLALLRQEKINGLTVQPAPLLTEQEAADVALDKETRL